MNPTKSEPLDELLKSTGQPDPKDVRYPQHPIDAFQQGAILDLRVRMAINLLQSRLFEGMGETHPKRLAVSAFSIADELLNQGAARGWVKPLPEDGGELTQGERDHARRTSSFGTLQQIEGQKFTRDEAARVVPPAPGFQIPRPKLDS